MFPPRAAYASRGVSPSRQPHQKSDRGEDSLRRCGRELCNRRSPNFFGHYSPLSITPGWLSYACKYWTPGRPGTMRPMFQYFSRRRFRMEVTFGRSRGETISSIPMPILKVRSMSSCGTLPRRAIRSKDRQHGPTSPKDFRTCAGGKDTRGIIRNASAGNMHQALQPAARQQRLDRRPVAAMRGQQDSPSVCRNPARGSLSGIFSCSSSTLRASE